MRKIVAILLLSVHLFNLVGYSILFQYFIAKADENIIKQADNNHYNDADLIQIKVPLNMPYINDTKDFERVNGQLEFNGFHYNSIKQKVSGDTLYVFCLPNVCKTELYKAKTSFAKEANDIPANKKNAGTLKKDNAANEYNTLLSQFSLQKLLVVSTTYVSTTTPFLSNAFVLIPKQPPKAFC